MPCFENIWYAQFFPIQFLITPLIMKLFFILLASFHTVASSSVFLTCSFKKFQSDCIFFGSEDIKNLVESKIEAIFNDNQDPVNADAKFISITRSEIPESLPENLSNFYADLEILRVTKTQLRTVRHEGLRNLTKLRHLSLDSNKIDFILPNSFEDLVSLESLFISNNKLDFLHENLFLKNSKLKSLWFDYNKIEDLKANIFINNLNLELISFAHNRLKNIQVNFVDCLKLFHVNFESNFKNCNLKYDAFLKSKEEKNAVLIEFQRDVDVKCKVL